MITIPKKKIVILIIGSIAVALMFTLIVFWISKVLTNYEKVPFGSLYLWKLITVFFSAYALVRPWGWKNKFQSLSEKHKITPKGENRFLLSFCYINFIAPVIYGMVLIFWGISFSVYLYFAGAAVLDILAWGVYTLKTSYGDTPKLTE